MLGLEKLKRLVFGYDATVSTTRRRSPKSDVKSEDDHLNASERRKLISTTRDLRRNFALTAWMIRKHLDFVATHTFQSVNRIKELDNQIENLMKWWGQKRNFDISKKHSLRRFTRLAEAGRTVDGDFFIWKSRRGYVSGIESDRIANASGTGLSANEFRKYNRGIRKSASGEHISYMLNDRIHGGGSLKFSKILSARDTIQFAYWDRIDQDRGISPMASGINSSQDVNESIIYALARAKVAQLFAFAMKRQSADSAGEVEGGTDADDNEDKSAFTIDFGKGPVILDLGPDDEAKFLETNLHLEDFKTFLIAVISLALKSLDIPYSFYDESFTNYSGARQALLLYFQSAAEKQKDVQELLDELTYWRLTLWVIDGIITLPPGMTVADLIWEWRPTGIPWIDPLKEVKGDNEAVEGVLTSRQRIARRSGNDFWEILAERAEEDKAIAKDLPSQKKELDADALIQAIAVKAAEIIDNQKESEEDDNNE